MKTFTFEQKKLIVEEWRSSGQSQEEFCRNHPAGVAVRTLRSWQKLCRERQAEPEPGVVSDHVTAALQAFEARLCWLDAALDRLGATVASCRADVDAAPACLAPASCGGGGTVEANDDEQLAGGMPAMGPSTVQAALVTEAEQHEQAVVEPIVQGAPPSARPRRRSLIDDFWLTSEGGEHKPTEPAIEREATAATVPESTDAQEQKTRCARWLAFPREWERGGGF